MIWDGLIALLALALGIAGWNVGIINSWRGPIAIVLATVATQLFYVDFATWIVQQLRIPPDQAVGLGYLLLWGMVEIIAELILNLVLPFGTKNRPMLFERIAGVALGLVKALFVVILPCMAMEAPINVPKPPPEKTPVINLIESGIDKSHILNIASGVAKGLLPSLGPFVVSTKQPSFKPDFRGNTALDENNAETKRK